jgi:pimeloyl-ACP methyl ester carboxylesterase
MTEAVYRDRFTPAPDGLMLHARDYGPEDPGRLPVLCLPGLTRNSHDFDVLATALSSGTGARRVIAVDYRGRGRSNRDVDWKHYDVAVETGDVLSQLGALGIGKALFVGTSRGGLITMATAATMPEMIAGAVLNDIGPVLDVAGLERIRGYVGKLKAPTTWDEAIALLKYTTGGQFTAVEEEDWRAYAEGTWREETDGSLALTYDPALMLSFAMLDFKALPDLWPAFETLRTVPLLAIRGATSDLLSEETLAEMARRHPRLEKLVVPGQGHAPLLRDAPTIARIRAFLDAVDPASA